ncbi:hypothetical protein CDD82_7412 [Ophiocordyceps australis]|uniref:DNA ligase n=1 Tax=Ophiocordyceps australis TaxID=1399860 RepID=A0A2C5YQG9_9HYPO|nr:hypothetical protein CDD82_7412 [Ophiocordyceps australis]
MVVSRQDESSPQKAADAIREDEMQYAHVESSMAELDQKFPNRPRNSAKTLPFHVLLHQLFIPLTQNKKQPARGLARNHGRHGPSPHEQRRHTIENFIRQWRTQVGNDFFPALRLILPDKDGDRGNYGLKENAIGKLLVKLLMIDKNSDDGYTLLHWKLPGKTAAARLAGDFAGRCYEVIVKRPMRTQDGDLTIAEVNAQLDTLAASSSEAENLAVLDFFYRRMSADELAWLIRIVLKQMKLGATEKTLLHLWHPDGEALFNVSSSLRRVCWELHDPNVRLNQEQAEICLMQCFQPQLAQFQMSNSFEKVAALLRPTAQDAEFWIEEKLDGERMQMHMVEDASHPGGRRFCFWSRKAKDYTYLYGNGLFDKTSSLTRHLGDAFAPGVRNLILDGEMITWDIDVDKMVAFGTLKTAALAEQQNQSGLDSAGGHRPLFRVFDILYLNDKQLTQYTLRDRHEALERVVQPVHRRLEIHEYTSAKSWTAIEPLLRDVIANASEGLVLKNPRSMYRLNSRNDDWLKVKPEYMTEFGESLDCVVIGGYYGTGRRGGTLAAFLCGLRASPNNIAAGASPEKCWSLFRVGGGFRAEDYAQIRQLTHDKWHKWHVKKPPSQYIALGGGNRRQHERPDMWIRPSDSIVLSVKAASIAPSDSYAHGFTLRFPRFRRIRCDRSWDSALSIDEFDDLRRRVDEEKGNEKDMTVDNHRQRRQNPKRVKRELVIAGQDAVKHEYAGQQTQLFACLGFCVLSESLRPWKQTKTQLEELIKGNGGTITQQAVPGAHSIILADKNVVKVASLVKHSGAKGIDIIRPSWVRDSLEQGILLPYEPRHVLRSTPGLERAVKLNADRFGDGFARDVSVDELRSILADMSPSQHSTSLDKDAFLANLEERGRHVSNMRAFMFGCFVMQIRPVGPVSKLVLDSLARRVRYCGGTCVQELSPRVTHVVLVGQDVVQVGQVADAVRREISSRPKVPHVVKASWIEDSWKAQTLLDEEGYSVCA